MNVTWSQTPEDIFLLDGAQIFFGDALIKIENINARRIILLIWSKISMPRNTSTKSNIRNPTRHKVAMATIYAGSISAVKLNRN